MYILPTKQMTISAYKKEYIYIVESALNKQTNKQTKEKKIVMIENANEN